MFNQPLGSLVEGLFNLSLLLSSNSPIQAKASYQAIHPFKQTPAYQGKGVCIAPPSPSPYLKKTIKNYKNSCLLLLYFIYLDIIIIKTIKVMTLDFQTPNKETVGWIDTYFQYHNSSTEREVERIASRHYDSRYDGWDNQPHSNVCSAFYEFKSAMIRLGISEDDINNQ